MKKFCSVTLTCQSKVFFFLSFNIRWRIQGFPSSGAGGGTTLPPHPGITFCEKTNETMQGLDRRFRNFLNCSTGSLKLKNQWDQHSKSLDAPLSGSKFFQFHSVFGKIWQNRKLAPPGGLAPHLWEILDPPLPSRTPPSGDYHQLAFLQRNYKYTC